MDTNTINLQISLINQNNVSCMWTKIKKATCYHVKMIYKFRADTINPQTHLVTKYNEVKSSEILEDRIIDRNILWTTFLNIPRGTNNINRYARMFSFVVEAEDKEGNIIAKSNEANIDG